MIVEGAIVFQVVGVTCNVNVLDEISIFLFLKG